MQTLSPSPKDASSHLVSPMSVMIVFGTRPEAIKMAPVIGVLTSDANFSVTIVTTGQHREMAREIMGPLGIKPDFDLDIMMPSQSLTDIVVAALSRLDKLCSAHRPDMLLIQGDTSTAFAAALAAFHRKIAIGHIEAGLRSRDSRHPYPEESNRRMISPLADLHFAPTRQAANNLAGEGVSADRIFVTGNTVVDALSVALGKNFCVNGLVEPGRDLVLITLHRREAWAGTTDGGSNVLGEILKGVRDAAGEHQETEFLYPMHRNPEVRRIAEDVLGGVENIKRVEPLGYFEFVSIMARARLIVTDSGGIQEEGPSLGVPVLVLRKTTERPEALRSGLNILVGTSAHDIRAAINAELRTRRPRPTSIPSPSNPFGDGRASQRIRDALLWFWGREPLRPQDFTPEQK